MTLLLYRPTLWSIIINSVRLIGLVLAVRQKGFIMRIEVIGFRKMDFITKEGQVIKGSSIYAVYPSKDKFVTGNVVWLKEDNYKNKKLPFVPESVCSDISLGFYDVSTDISNGSIDSFVKVK